MMDCDDPTEERVECASNNEVIIGGQGFKVICEHGSTDVYSTSDQAWAAWELRHMEGRFEPKHHAWITTWKGWEAYYGPAAQAKCPCGWKGPERPLYGDLEKRLAGIAFAVDDANRHRIENGHEVTVWSEDQIREKDPWYVAPRPPKKRWWRRG